MFMHNNVLFIDAGGTKIKVELWSIKEKKRLFETRIEQMGNLFLSEEVTRDSFEKVIFETRKLEIDKILISMAGFSNKIQQHINFKEWLKKEFKVEDIEIKKDIVFLAEAFCEDDQSIATIFGTGSAYSTIIDGEVKILGGWGHLFGDEGSAYSYSKRIILEVILEIENDLDILKTHLFNYFNIETTDQFKEKLYGTKYKSDIASIAQYFDGIDDENAKDKLRKLISREAISVVEKITSISKFDNLKTMYVDGGFARKNRYFIKQISKLLSNVDIKIINWDYGKKYNPIYKYVDKLKNRR